MQKKIHCEMNDQETAAAAAAKKMESQKELFMVQLHYSKWPSFMQTEDTKEIYRNHLFSLPLCVRLWLSA